MITRTRDSLDQISFKIFGYILKGFFLIIKKGYEQCAKDLDNFFQVHLNGNGKVTKSKITKKISKADKEKPLTLQNLSLMTENTQFDFYVSDQLISDKVNKSLRTLSKIILK